MNKTASLLLAVLAFWVTLGVFNPAIWKNKDESGLTGYVALAQEQATDTAPVATTSSDTPTFTSQAPSETPLQPTATLVPPTPPLEASITSEPEETEFVIFKIEPDRISKESGGTLSIYGSGFKAGVAVRLVGYGLLDAALLNPTAIRAVVPPNLREGRYGVEVIQSDGNSLKVGNAVRIRYSLPKPTDTTRPGTPVAVARPELVIEAAESDPDPVRPGSTFRLRLQIVNHGSYTATNIRVALASTDLAVPREGSSLVVLEKLDAAQQETVELVLALDKEAPTGYLGLPLAVEYSDYLRRDYASQQNVGLNAGDTADGQPLVLLRRYETRPPSLSPGDAFTLHLELANVGGQDASQLLVTLGGQDGEGTQPFAILGSGNVQFIPNLQAGQGRELDLQLILDGSAESGVYNLPVSLTYQGPDRTSRTESQVVNLLVSRKPNLAVDYYDPPPTGQIGQPVELSIEVVNIGRNQVNVSTIEVTGDGLQVQEGSAFVGALDGGTSGTLDAILIPEKSGSLPIVVTVSYLDDFNQPQTITQTLKVEVEQPEPTPGGPDQDSEEQPAGFWNRLVRFFRGIIGLGS